MGKNAEKRAAQNIAREPGRNGFRENRVIKRSLRLLPEGLHYMFCPKCRAEYIDGITVCDDCGTGLVDKLPEETSENTGEYRKLSAVFTTNNSVEANFIKSLLGSNNIECFISNEYLVSINILFSQAIQMKVMVSQKHEARAKEIISQYYEDLRNNAR